MLPTLVKYETHSAWHIVTHLQMFLFAVFAFIFTKNINQVSSTISLDFDWFYRKGINYLLIKKFYPSNLHLTHQRHAVVNPLQQLPPMLLERSQSIR